MTTTDKTIWADHVVNVVLGTNIPFQNIWDTCDLLVDAARNRVPLYIAGNGAQAALSQHWAADFMKGSSSDRKSVSAISLASNMSYVTAVGNDINFESIFTNQLHHHTERTSRGIVILLSASGKSPNVVHTARFVRETRPMMKIVSLTGFDGEPLRSLSNINLHVPISEYEVVEDVHCMLMHTFAKAVRRALANDFSPEKE